MEPTGFDCPGPEKVQNTSEQTVGEFLDELSQKADIDQKTLESYAGAFRTIR
jgi:hypothetical protein